MFLQIGDMQYLTCLGGEYDSHQMLMRGGGYLMLGFPNFKGDK
jgi:hypothetical protein